MWLCFLIFYINFFNFLSSHQSSWHSQVVQRQKWIWLYQQVCLNSDSCIYAVLRLVVHMIGCVLLIATKAWGPDYKFMKLIA